jgi:hypothetical protein
MPDWRSIHNLAFALVLFLVGAAAPVEATPNTALVLTSNGADGDPFAGDSSESFIINTNDGTVSAADGSGNYIYSFTLPSLTVTQGDGSQVRVFDVSSFTVPQGVTINLSGSMAAAIVASGNISINGTLNAGTFKLGNGIGAGSGAFSGGLGVASSNGAQGSGPSGSGGGGGAGLAAYVGSPCCGHDSASGGGGGGSASPGQPGVAGALYSSGTNGSGGPGGNASFTPSVLQGGGGGGAGAGGSTCCVPITGADGAAGGGALLLETPDSISVGSTGLVEANGQNGTQGCVGEGGGNGGGGGAGELWFDAGNSVINAGTIDAIGGAGAGPCLSNPPANYPGSSGAGSGGVVVFDPLSIENDGIIDVADGNGGSVYGGLVETFGQPITGAGQITGEQEVPEPATTALLLAGLGTLGLIRRRVRPRGLKDL